MATTHHLHPLVLLPGQGQHLPRQCLSQPQRRPFSLVQPGSTHGRAPPGLQRPCLAAGCYAGHFRKESVGEGPRSDGENQRHILKWGSGALSQLEAFLHANLMIFSSAKAFKGAPVLQNKVRLLILAHTGLCCLRGRGQRHNVTLYPPCLL